MLPVAVLLLAIAVTAEVAQLAGVSDVAAHAPRAPRPAPAVVCTIVLSLDATAVLLTPVGLAIARQTGAPLPLRAHHDLGSPTPARFSSPCPT